MQSLRVALWILMPLVLLALAFGFMKGYRDAAHSIATVVSTGVLKPGQAVWFVSLFNFLALFVFGLAVATTVAQGMVQAHGADTHVVFGALFGALGWSLLTWYFAIPSSSSHALIGGLLGAIVAKAGGGALIASGMGKSILFIVVAPLLGLFLGSLLMLVAAWIFRRATPSRVDQRFRRLQLLSAAAYSLGHGGNGAQQTTGLIWLLLVSAGYTSADAAVPPGWTLLAAYLALAAGTLVGGWHVIRSKGQRITKLKPVGGFCAETAAALSLFFASALGVPVSSTHTITAAVIGVGSGRRASVLRWGVASNIVWAWVLTLPASALLAALGYWASRVVY